MKLGEGICSENQFALGADGWAMLAPYGEFPGVSRKLNANGGAEKREAIQVVDRAAALADGLAAPGRSAFLRNVTPHDPAATMRAVGDKRR